MQTDTYTFNSNGLKDNPVARDRTNDTTKMLAQALLASAAILAVASGTWLSIIHSI